MKKAPLFLIGLLILILPVAVQSQSYTNSYGVWGYSTNNGTVTITKFQGYGSSFTSSNSAVTVPSSINGLPVTTIGPSALYGDYMALTSITLPNSVTSIAQFAFAQCTYLTNALIGNGVTNIGDYAFSGDNDLLAIYFLGNAPDYSTNYVFSGDRNATAYYTPPASGWSNTFAGLPTVVWNPPMPALGIGAYSNCPVLFFSLPASFPTSVGTNYVLQMTTNLASSNWVTVTNGVSIICVQITNATSPTYFRLQP